MIDSEYDPDIKHSCEDTYHWLRAMDWCKKEGLAPAQHEIWNKALFYTKSDSEKRLVMNHEDLSNLDKNQLISLVILEQRKLKSIDDACSGWFSCNCEPSETLDKVTKMRLELDKAKSFLIVANMKKELESKDSNNPRIEFIYAYEEKDGSIHFTDYHNNEEAEEMITTRKCQRLDWTRKEKDNE